MNNPRFSVVIPVHNSERTIAAALRSVLAQSFTDFEIIAIDDGSTDNSVRTMLPLAECDERVRVVAKAQEGVSATRNCGAELARGEFLAFLDADDCWHPHKLLEHHRLHATYQGVEASFAKIAFRSARQDGTLADPITFSTVKLDPINLEAVLSENPVCTTSNFVIRRATFLALGGFRRDMRHAEDQEFLARYVDSGHRILGIDEWLVDYRLSPDGLSCDYEAMLAGWRRLATDFAGSFDMRRGEAVYCRYLARRILRAGGPASLARRMALRGLYADWRAFFSDVRRGGLTLTAAIGSSLLPRRLRTSVFA